MLLTREQKQLIASANGPARICLGKKGLRFLLTSSGITPAMVNTTVVWEDTCWVDLLNPEETMQDLYLGSEWLADRTLATSSIRFTYIDAQHDIMGHRYRFLKPFIATDGKLRRYMQRTNDDLDYYAPPAIDWDKLLDPDCDLFICEGEKGAIVLNHYFIALGQNRIAIAIGGVYNWCEKDEDEDKRKGGRKKLRLLRPKLRSDFEWENRKVFLTFDSDGFINNQVANAKQEFSTSLTAIGAEVYEVDLVDSRKDPSKMGPDDHVAIHGWSAYEERIRKARRVGMMQHALRRFEPSETKLDKLPNKPWLWKPWLPEGYLAIFAGAAGTMKSSIMWDLAGRVTSDRPMPTADDVNPKMIGRGYVQVGTEDDWEKDVRPRVELAGGDLKRFAGIDPEDIGRYGLKFLIEAVKQVDAAIVTFDIATDMMDVWGLDPNKRRDVKTFCNKLYPIASRYDVTMVLLFHPNKDESIKNALNRISGSYATVGTVRSVITASEMGNMRLLSQAKISYAKKGRSVEFDFDENVGRIIWKGERNITADQAMNGNVPKSQLTMPDKGRWMAMRTLVNCVSKEVPSNEAKKMAEMTSACSNETVDRAIAELKKWEIIGSAKRMAGNYFFQHGSNFANAMSVIREKYEQMHRK